MSIIEAIILGLVQGLTEFIPVSSSGHLLLAHELLGTPADSLAFDVMLHIGTLLALLLYFYRDIWNMATQITKQTSEGKLARLLILATIPAVIGGLLFGNFIEDSLRSTTVVVITLASVAILMLLAEARESKKKPADITTKQGMSVGLAQVLALIPGVSRSGITMTAGLFSGMSRTQAARFSFLLAIPIIAGSALGILLRNTDGIAFELPLLLGLLTAFISGYVAIAFLLRVIAKVGLKPFAYYRIILAVIVLLFMV